MELFAAGLGCLIGKLASKYYESSIPKEWSLKIETKGVIHNSSPIVYEDIDKKKAKDTAKIHKTKSNTRNAGTMTEEFLGKELSLPLKRSYDVDLDPFNYLEDLRKAMPLQGKGDVLKKLFDVHDHPAKKMPLYGTTSPIPKRKII